MTLCGRRTLGAARIPTAMATEVLGQIDHSAPNHDCRDSLQGWRDALRANVSLPKHVLISNCATIWPAPTLTLAAAHGYRNLS